MLNICWTLTQICEQGTWNMTLNYLNLTLRLLVLSVLFSYLNKRSTSDCFAWHAWHVMCYPFMPCSGWSSLYNGHFHFCCFGWKLFFYYSLSHDKFRSQCETSRFLNIHCTRVPKKKKKSKLFSIPAIISFSCISFKIPHKHRTSGKVARNHST